MKRVVVTGVRGFLGRHWARFLVSHGVEVHGFSRQAGGGRVLAPDPFDVASLTAALRDAAPDRIFHLAGVADTHDVALFYRVNAVYAANLFAAAEAAGLSDRPVVVVGTAAEYGPVAACRLPIVEDEPCRPQGHYGISKLAQTQMAQATARAGRRVIVVRPSNMIGPGMPGHMALQQFAQQIVAAKRAATPTIATGDLRVVRDFIDVEDVCARLWALCQGDRVASGEIVNVASGRGLPLREALDRLIAVAGGGLETRMDPARLRAHDLCAHVASTAKLERFVGPMPLTPLDETLQRILRACETPEPPR